MTKAEEPWPRYFTSLTVRNLRAFGEGANKLSLEDKDGNPARWTILLGDNGTGKTALLESLFAFDVFEEGGKDSKVSRSLRGFSYGYRKGLRAQGDNSSFHTEKETVLSASITAGGNLDNQEGTHRYVQEIKYNKHGGGVSRDTHPYGMRIIPYSASRQMSPTVLSETSGKRADSLLDNVQFLVNAEEWLLQLLLSSLVESEVQNAQSRRYGQVREALLRILPDIIDIRSTTPSSTSPSVRVEFNHQFDGWLPLASLGLGYRNAIAWIVDLANYLYNQYPDSPDPLSEPAVVLIDEIDLHLHPGWQRSITSYLSERFVNAQFIVTAHSPLIVQGAKGANVAVLKRDPSTQRVCIVNNNRDVSNWRIDQLLASDLFGMPSGRPPHYDQLILERSKILRKAILTSADYTAIKKIENQLKEFPLGDSAAEIEANSLLYESLALSRIREQRLNGED